MAKKKKESHLLSQMLKKIAPQIGASVLTEPEWGIAGQITFKNGKRTYFRYNTLDLNPIGSSDIAKDKDYAQFFMHALGYPTVPGSKTFFRDDWAEKIGARNRGVRAALAHAAMLGFPVVAKPNSGSQGKDVTFAHTKRELTCALREIFKHDKIAIVQKPVPGTDYRIVVLDNAVISAYARIPLTIIGDGRRTIQALILNLEKHFRKAERDTHIRMNDPRITAKLKRIGYTLSSIPEKGEKISLLDNANLSAGGTSVDVTQSIHSGFKKMAVALTKDMGLRLCGVDLMVNGDITRPPKEFYIIEINAAPGLDHYAKSGKEQQKIVEKLYTRILKSLSKG